MRKVTCFLALTAAALTAVPAAACPTVYRSYSKPVVYADVYTPAVVTAFTPLVAVPVATYFAGYTGPAPGYPVAPVAAPAPAVAAPAASPCTAEVSALREELNALKRQMGQRAEAPAKAEAPPAASAVTKLAVAQSRCAACHARGKEGIAVDGKTPKLVILEADGKSFAPLTDKEWRNVTKRTYNGTMPPKTDAAGHQLPPLTDQEAAAFQE